MSGGEKGMPMNATVFSHGLTFYERGMMSACSLTMSPFSSSETGSAADEHGECE